MASAMPPHQPFIRWRMSGDAHPYPQQTHDQGRANRPGEPPLLPLCGKERQRALFTTKKRRSTKKELPSFPPTFVVFVCFVANNPLQSCCSGQEINSPLPEGVASAMPPRQPFIRWRMSEDAHPYPQQPIFPVSKAGRGVPTEPLFSPFSCIP